MNPLVRITLINNVSLLSLSISIVLVLSIPCLSIRQLAFRSPLDWFIAEYISRSQPHITQVDTSIPFRISTGSWQEIEVPYSSVNIPSNQRSIEKTPRQRDWTRTHAKGWTLKLTFYCSLPVLFSPQPFSLVISSSIFSFASVANTVWYALTTTCVEPLTAQTQKVRYPNFCRFFFAIRTLEIPNDIIAFTGAGWETAFRVEHVTTPSIFTLKRQYLLLDSEPPLTIKICVLVIISSPRQFVLRATKFVNQVRWRQSLIGQHSTYKGIIIQTIDLCLHSYRPSEAPCAPLPLPLSNWSTRIKKIHPSLAAGF